MPTVLELYWSTRLVCRTHVVVTKVLVCSRSFLRLPSQSIEMHPLFCKVGRALPTSSARPVCLDAGACVARRFTLHHRDNLTLRHLLSPMLGIRIPARNGGDGGKRAPHCSDLSVQLCPAGRFAPPVSSSNGAGCEAPLFRTRTPSRQRSRWDRR